MQPALWKQISWLEVAAPAFATRKIAGFVYKAFVGLDGPFMFYANHPTAAG
jgi:hypothetical protein